MGCEMIKRAWRRRAVIIGLVLTAGVWLSQARAADNLSFKGRLVAQACTIRAGDEAQELGFHDISSQFLYLNTRTAGESLSIHLEACDTSVAASVTTTFSGNESVELPGLLALAAGSRARGIAIGLETLANAPLPLNMASEKQALVSGSNVIEFKAYVKGEPRAIADKSIRAGSYTAVSTFMLSYQ